MANKDRFRNTIALVALIDTYIQAISDCRQRKFSQPVNQNKDEGKCCAETAGAIWRQNFIFSPIRYTKHLNSLKNNLSRAQGESLPSGFEAIFAAVFVLIYRLREFSGWTGVCRSVFTKVPSANYRNLLSYPLLR